ncbi:pyridoxamine 5'-phosphate oxidase family protein [Saccharopolyspora flava]|uniref:PPOX class probable F420-dependent enzyme n=1 Tax=Saccharopolyspora flava TaxID=95161 RepID=A0A1I6TM69_9PSEU|nr:TIGR03618 family F420-dependent PPOX class oxidoreductase [Saccharopolyspora flava]SFS90319.1 PPOX class probable F420-dependent enzyme [Saccharopolyspora flava]
MTIDPAATEPKDSHFWQERRICFLATQRPDGSPHLVPVGATFDAETGIARIISSAGTRKVRNVLAAGPDVVVAVSQVEGRRWGTLEGKALIKDDPESVAEAERRYAQRYRPPRPNPTRVVIEITVTRVMGNVRTPGW